jgi:tellurium resistance protein TerZ
MTSTSTSPIDLSKGQKINLSKADGTSLTNVCLGLNWGAIQKKGIFGMGGSTEAVDLDASCAVFDATGRLIETVSFRNLTARGGWIKHSGDDRVGDTDGDDGTDNETISVDLSKAPGEAAHVVFFLNSFQGHDFATIPYATIRIYEGAPRPIIDADVAVVGKYNVAHDPSFANHVSMVMGRLYKRDGVWKFQTIGQATRDRRLEETVQTIGREYLNG